MQSGKNCPSREYRLPPIVLERSARVVNGGKLRTFIRRVENQNLIDYINTFTYSEMLYSVDISLLLEVLE